MSAEVEFWWEPSGTLYIHGDPDIVWDSKPPRTAVALRKPCNDTAAEKEARFWDRQCRNLIERAENAESERDQYKHIADIAIDSLNRLAGYPTDYAHGDTYEAALQRSREKESGGTQRE